MSKAKVDEVEKRIVAEQTKAARAYAKLERLGEDLARVDKALEEMGIKSIDEARERLKVLHERMNALINTTEEELKAVESAD